MKKFSQLVLATGITVLLGTAAYASSSSADTVAKSSETVAQEVQKITYACKDNKNFQVVFINGEKNSYAVITQMDEVLPLAQVVSASGAVYKVMSEDYNYELVTKGDTAFLMSGNDPVYVDCTIANKAKLTH